MRTYANSPYSKGSLTEYLLFSNFITGSEMAKYNQVSFIYYCPLVMWLKYTSGLCKFDHENVCMYENVCKLTSLHTMVTTMITQGKRLWFKEILKVIFVFSSFATLYISYKITFKWYSMINFIKDHVLKVFERIKQSCFFSSTI